MATHPISDARTKASLIARITTLLTSRTTAIPETALGEEGVQGRVARSVALVLAAYAASVVEGALGAMGVEEREEAFGRCDDVLAAFAVWPWGEASTSSSGGGGLTAPSTSGGSGSGIFGSGGGAAKSESTRELVRAVKREMKSEEDPCYEVVATVFEVFSRMDSLL